MASTRGACNIGSSRVLKTSSGGLLVRDDRGVDEVGICGVGPAESGGVVLVTLVFMTQEAVMVGMVILGWDRWSSNTGDAAVVKLVLVSCAVNSVSIGDGSVTNSGSCMKGHGRLVVMVTITMAVTGVQGIDGLLTSMVGGRRVTSVGKSGVVGAVEARTGLVRVVVEVTVVGILLSAGDFVGQVGSLLLNLLHGGGLGSRGGGGVGSWVIHFDLFVVFVGLLKVEVVDGGKVMKEVKSFIPFFFQSKNGAL